jgi:L-lactate dehydrogenase complex protein LldG
MATTARETILKKIRQALAKAVPVPFADVEAKESVFEQSGEDLAIEFASNFTRLQGKFSYCANENDLAVQLATLISLRKWNKIFCREADLKYKLHSNGFDDFEYADIATCDASITTCESLIARTGSIVMSTAQQSGRVTSVYAPVHICIAYTDQVLHDIGDSLQAITDKGKLPSLITLATGPSRTADIEKTLVVGVHGPKEVFVFLVEK